MTTFLILLALAGGYSRSVPNADPSSPTIEGKLECGALERAKDFCNTVQEGVAKLNRTIPRTPGRYVVNAGVVWDSASKRYVSYIEIINIEKGTSIKWGIDFGETLVPHDLAIVMLRDVGRALERDRACGTLTQECRKGKLSCE